MMSSKEYTSRKRDAREAKLSGYIFDGSKESFQELEFHVRSEVANQVGPEGLLYLFPEEPWPEAPGTRQRRGFSLFTKDLFQWKYRRC